MRLLNRTSRSVTLTAAGEDFYAALTAPFDAIGTAVEGLNCYRDDPAGRISLNVMEHASSLLLAPVLPVFVERYPGIAIDVAITNHMVDVVAQGADAGIRWGGTVPEDMVAQRLSSDIPWVVVGSPAYLERHGVPAQCSDQSHDRVDLGVIGRMHQAINYPRLAVAFNPFSPFDTAYLAELLGFYGDVGEANAILRAAQQRFPGHAQLALADFSCRRSAAIQSIRHTD